MKPMMDNPFFQSAMDPPQAGVPALPPAINEQHVFVVAGSDGEGGRSPLECAVSAASMAAPVHETRSEVCKSKLAPHDERCPHCGAAAPVPDHDERATMMHEDVDMGSMNL